ncbi:MAG: PLP-dependent aminotransferase family protein [Caldilineae bacterium]|nr:MAG: PLP-dependent aminotransferase family protein [Caldilineae bacterium]
MSLQIPLDRESTTPLYQQIKQAFIEAIERGELPPLTRLPATRKLARQLGVNRVTVVTAYAELAAEGYISSHVGRGSYVLDRAERAAEHEWRSAPPSLRDPAEWTAHTFNREMLRLARRPDILSFAPGMPATDLLPVDAYRLALNKVLRRDGAEVLQYAPLEGYPPLHQAIVEELAAFGIRVEPEDLLVTSGAEQALALVLRTLLRPGDTMLIEHPTYMHVLDLLAGSGIHVQPVPLDEGGLQADKLPELVARHRPKLLYLTPTFQNPTGVCLDPDRARRLLTLAAENDIILLEDDVYRHLWFYRPPPPPLRALDPADNVIYINGYSKCLLPGARIGYLIPPRRFREALRAAHQTLDIAAGELHQRALALYFQEGGFGSHLRRLRQVYRQRLEAMLAALARYMPQGTRWTRPDGGLYIWLQLPRDGPGATTLYVHALELGVAFAPGHLFYLPGRAHPGSLAAHSLRLNFALHSPEAIEDGIRRLALAWCRAGGETAPGEGC